MCTRCAAVFTTLEEIVLKDVVVVSDESNKLAGFSRDKLFLSLYSCLKHRFDPINDASALTATITSKLLRNSLDKPLSTATIKQTSLIALNRFDKTAATLYSSL